MIQLSPDGKTLASTRRLRDWDTGRERARLAWTCSLANHVGWSDDSRYLAVEAEYSDRVVAFRAADGSVATKVELPTCGNWWLPKTHVLASRLRPATATMHYQRVTDGARLWLVPGIDQPVSAISSTGDFDGKPYSKYLPPGVGPERPCAGLVALFMAGKPCP